MEKKKSEKFDYEKKRGLFFWIGLSISLLFVISAFEWKSEYEIRVWENTRDVFEPVDQSKITIQDPPKPLKKEKKVIPKELIAVKDDVKVPEDVIALIDTEDLSNDAIDSLLAVEIPIEEPETYMVGVIESDPEPEGGYKGFYSFMGNNIKYPREAKMLRIEGRVFIRFVVNEKGEIVESEVVRGIGGGCDAEALRVIKKVPAWTPGKQRGKPVRVRMVLPITFRLN